MRMASASVAVLLILAGATTVSAQSSTAMLAVTATVEGSLTLTVKSVCGGSQSGMQSAAASTAVGNVSRSGSVPAGFSRTLSTGSWTLACTILLTTNAAGLTNSYTLTAQLTSSPATGVEWTANDIALSSSSAATVTNNASYGSDVSYPWAIIIQDNAPTGAIGNTIAFTAISN